jgi:(p)ppGpp synthase/HD superfamily hydrolase
MFDLYRTALDFAARAHGDQKRRYTGEPYICHLFAVAATVSRFGGDRYAVQAALLHDVLEDTPTTYEDLRGHFPNAAPIVLLLTDCGKEVGNRASRKAVDRARIAAAPSVVQDIKLADLIDNTVSIARHDPEFALVYMAEKRALLDALNDCNPLLKAAAEIAYEKAQHELAGYTPHSTGGAPE